MPRVVPGSEAQLSHLSRDRASLAPGAVISSRWIFRLGCWLHKESILLWGDDISSGDQWRGALGISLSMGARGLGITRSSLAILTLAISSSSSWWISSSSWWISSSRRALSSSMWRTSSSSIRQSSMRFSNFEMDLSTALREVCREFNLCSISLRDGASVITSMVFDTASNSLWSLVRLLRHFRREEVDSVRFLSLCLLFSPRTWSITSSNWRPQAVLGPRK